MRTVIVNSHPIQYFGPFYKELSPRLEGGLTLVYCSKKGVTESDDPLFGRRFRWDINLLDGYESRFIPGAEKNADRDTPQIDCSTLSRVLDDLSPEVLVVHGYYDPAARATLAWARRNPSCALFMRGDTWSGSGEAKKGLLRTAKRWWVRHRVVPLLAGYLAVGRRNGAYWKELGAPSDRIHRVVYGVDKARFFPKAQSADERLKCRQELGLDPDLPVLGFMGRLCEKKGLLQYLQHRIEHRVSCEGFQMLIVGDGPLSAEVGRALSRAAIRTVSLGFCNQTQLPELYRTCDAIVVPSVFGETWGFVVQEALACGVPVFASEAVGSAPDLIEEGTNGRILPTAGWDAWTDAIRDWAQNPRVMGDAAATWVGVVPGFLESAEAMASALRNAGPAWNRTRTRAEAGS